MPPARISLTLSRHFSLLFIASGRSSGLHPVSSHSCCMFVKWHKSSLRAILCRLVRELHSLYIHIYIFCLVSLHFLFFCPHSIQIWIKKKPRSIWPKDDNTTGNTTLSQSGFMSNDREELFLHSSDLKNWSLTMRCNLDTATRVQILDETDCISHSTNTLGKGMNPIILPPAMGK